MFVYFRDSVKRVREALSLAHFQFHQKSIEADAMGNPVFIISLKKQYYLEILKQFRYLAQALAELISRLSDLEEQAKSFEEPEAEHLHLISEQLALLRQEQQDFLKDEQEKSNKREQKRLHELERKQLQEQQELDDALFLDQLDLEMAEMAKDAELNLDDFKSQGKKDLLDLLDDDSDVNDEIRRMLLNQFDK